MVLAGLGWLAGADLAGVPAAVQAECLRVLERARSVQTVAHASVLRAFDASLGFEDDGCRSPRTWLMWQTLVTPATATDLVRRSPPGGCRSRGRGRSATGPSRCPNRPVRRRSSGRLPTPG
jgi:hypothetical protein